MALHIGPACVMDAMVTVILTLPIVFPLITAPGLDPLWFGMIVVMTLKPGFIRPPLGMNVFVIRSVIGDIRTTPLFAGVPPPVATDPLRLLILPFLSTSLPSHM